ncbi:MAG: DUF2191 domain-containing protein [Pseudomonadota bacterium]|nr:DUF2191 domain-containing protein [Pseudomonadota bacterium]
MTIDIADAVLADATRFAAKEGTTIAAVVEDGLRMAMQGRRSRAPFRLRDASFRGEGLWSEFKNATWEDIRGVAYAGRAR